MQALQFHTQRAAIRGPVASANGTTPSSPSTPNRRTCRSETTELSQSGPADEPSGTGGDLPCAAAPQLPGHCSLPAVSGAPPPSQTRVTPLALASGCSPSL